MRAHDGFAGNPRPNVIVLSSISRYLLLRFFRVWQKKTTMPKTCLRLHMPTDINCQISRIQREASCDRKLCPFLLRASLNGLVPRAPNGGLVHVGPRVEYASQERRRELVLKSDWLNRNIHDGSWRARLTMPGSCTKLTQSCSGVEMIG